MHCVKFIVVVLTAFNLHIIAGLETVTDDAARLRRDLFDPQRYDKLNSPNHQNHHDMVVTMKVLVLHIYEMNEHYGVITVNGWFLASWEDYRLNWNIEDYGQTYFIKATQDSIWLPDLVLYNDAYSLQMNKFADAQVLVSSAGYVYWGAPTTLRSTCAIDHKLYPFDEHYCNINIGSWSNTYNMMLDLHYVDKYHEEDVLKQFSSPNPSWDLFSHTDQIINRTYVCCPNQVFPFFELRLGIRRQSPFFKFFLITPAILCTFLTLCVFWVPVQGQGNTKIFLGAISTLINTVLMSFLGWEIPQGGKSIPAIVLFLGNSLVMTVLSISASVAVSKTILLSRTRRPVPHAVQIVTNIFGKWSCMDTGNSNLWAKFVSSVTKTGARSKDDPQLLDNTQVEIGGEEGLTPETDQNKMLNRDWIDVCVAFDRICFIVFCFIFVCITFSAFL